MPPGICSVNHLYSSGDIYHPSFYSFIHYIIDIWYSSYVDGGGAVSDVDPSSARVLQLL